MFRQWYDDTDVLLEYKEFPDKLYNLLVLLSVLSLMNMNNPYRVFFPQDDPGAHKHLVGVSPHSRWLLLVDKLFGDNKIHCHKLQSTQTTDQLPTYRMQRHLQQI